MEDNQEESSSFVKIFKRGGSGGGKVGTRGRSDFDDEGEEWGKRTCQSPKGGLLGGGWN